MNLLKRTNVIKAGILILRLESSVAQRSLTLSTLLTEWKPGRDLSLCEVLSKLTSVYWIDIEQYWLYCALTVRQNIILQLVTYFIIFPTSYCHLLQTRSITFCGRFYDFVYVGIHLGRQIHFQNVANDVYVYDTGLIESLVAFLQTW